MRSMDRLPPLRMPGLTPRTITSTACSTQKAAMNVQEMIPIPTSVPRFGCDWGRIAAEVGKGRGRSEEWVRQHSAVLGYLTAAGVVIVRHGELALGTQYPLTDAAEMVLCWSRDFLSKQAQQTSAMPEIAADELEDKLALAVRQHTPSPAYPIDADELERKLALAGREHAHTVDELKRQIVDLQARNERLAAGFYLSPVPTITTSELDRKFAAAVQEHTQTVDALKRQIVDLQACNNRLTAERALLSAPVLDDPVALSPIEEQWPEVLAVAKNWQRKAVTAWCVAAAGWLGLVVSAIGMIFW